MTDIEFRPAAAKDLEEAAQWYEAQRSGLGSEFLEAVRTALDAIVENPEQFPVLDGMSGIPAHGTEDRGRSIRRISVHLILGCVMFEFLPLSFFGAATLEASDNAFA